MLRSLRAGARSEFVPRGDPLRARDGGGYAHVQGTADAEGHGRVAGREHVSVFEQIADFCKLHPLEVKGIADGEVARGIKGLDPISTGQLTREEIERGEADPDYRLKMAEPKVRVPKPRPRRARATPRSRAARTAPTPSSGCSATIPSSRTRRSCASWAPPRRPSQPIRERTHWNSANLAPMDPVTLGLCSQIDLDFEVSARRQGSASGRDPAGEPDSHAGGALDAPEPERPTFADRPTIRPEREADDRRRFGVRQAQAAQAPAGRGRRGIAHARTGALALPDDPGRGLHVRDRWFQGRSSAMRSAGTGRTAWPLSRRKSFAVSSSSSLA